VSAQFLDEAAREAFARAISDIESASSVEVVVAFRRRSSTYRHANIVVAAMAAFVSLATMLFVDHAFSLAAILIDPFVMAVIAGFAVEWLPGVKRVLTPAGMKRAKVERLARATFIERGVHATRDRTGLLVYMSWLEQEIVLVPDVGLRVPAELAAKLEATQAMRDGGVAVAKVLGSFASALADVAPRRGDDVNELPDAIVEHDA
jgi:putative membrane protein